MKRLLSLALVFALLLLPLSASAIDKEEFRKILDLVPEMTMTQVSRIYRASKKIMVEKYSMALDPSPEQYLSGLSFDELIALREQLNLAIWNCQEWQEVTVPIGTWVVGVDIPAGHWSIRPANSSEYFYVSAFDRADEAGKGPKNCTFSWSQDICGRYYSNPFNEDVPFETDILLKEGWYFKTNGVVVFTPYSGHADFGFQ